MRKNVQDDKLCVSCKRDRFYISSDLACRMAASLLKEQLYSVTIHGTLSSTIDGCSVILRQLLLAVSTMCFDLSSSLSDQQHVIP